MAGSATARRVADDRGVAAVAPRAMMGTQAIVRSRTRDLAFVMLGVLALVAKRQLAVLWGPLVHDYGGNVAASFAAFFVLKLPFADARLRVAGAAVLALVAATSFEFTDGFGFMSNTYDPSDYLANAVGVILALAVEGIAALVARRRARSSGRA